MATPTKNMRRIPGALRLSITSPYAGILVVVLIPMQMLVAEAREITRELDDGTIIVQSFDADERLVREEIFLSNGRHKSTFFNQYGTPQYALVSTASGSFGMMYYDQADAPVFKFWDHGNHDYLIQTYSAGFEKIGAIGIESINGERKVTWTPQEGVGDHQPGVGLVAPLVGLIIGLLFGIGAGYYVGFQKRLATTNDS